jgi:5,10-methylenetetrahydrofolate reductase
MNFAEKLSKGKFLITAEIAPPRGTDFKDILESIKPLKGKVDAFNVTDCQRSNVRMSAVAMSKILLENGFEPIFQITCRDRNRIALQSELLGAWALGIKVVCVMTGDFTTLGDHPESKPVFDVDSLGLLEIVKKLNSGTLLNGRELKGKPSFTVGAVFNPYAGPKRLQVEKLKLKVELGARFIQTQPIYDAKLARETHELISSFGAIPILGILPLRSPKMARFMEKLNPGSVPKELVERLEESQNPVEYGWKKALELSEEIAEFGRGIHFMLVGKIKELAQFAVYLKRRNHEVRENSRSRWNNNGR